MASEQSTPKKCCIETLLDELIKHTEAIARESRDQIKSESLFTEVAVGELIAANNLNFKLRGAKLRWLTNKENDQDLNL